MISIWIWSKSSCVSTDSVSSKSVSLIRLIASVSEMLQRARSGDVYSAEEIFSCDEEVFSAAEEVSHGGVILFVAGCELDRDELGKELCRVLMFHFWEHPFIDLLFYLVVHRRFNEQFSILSSCLLQNSWFCLLNFVLQFSQSVCCPLLHKLEQLPVAI